MKRLSPPDPRGQVHLRNLSFQVSPTKRSVIKRQSSALAFFLHRSCFLAEHLSELFLSRHLHEKVWHVLLCVCVRSSAMIWEYLREDQSCRAGRAVLHHPAERQTQIFTSLHTDTTLDLYPYMHVCCQIDKEDIKRKMLMK